MKTSILVKTKSRPGMTFTLKDAGTETNRTPSAVYQAILRSRKSGKPVPCGRFEWEEATPTASAATDEPTHTETPPAVDAGVSVGLSPIEIGNLIVNLLKGDPTPGAEKIARQIAWANRVRADHELLAKMLLPATPDGSISLRPADVVGSEERPVADGFRSPTASEDSDPSINDSGSVDDLSRDEIAKGEG